MQAARVAREAPASIVTSYTPLRHNHSCVLARPTSGARARARTAVAQQLGEGAGELDENFPCAIVVQQHAHVLVPQSPDVRPREMDAA